VESRALEDQPMTFEAAAALDPDLHPGELDRGRWVPAATETWRHGTLVANITVLLKQYARAHPGWSVAAADPGTKLARDPDLLRGPDVAMIRAERVPTGKGVDGWLEGAPDLAVEVAGDSQSHAELAGKALEYLAAGAKCVWVVDANQEKVVVYTPPDHVRVLGSGDRLEGGEAFPGFECQISELFECSSCFATQHDDASRRTQRKNSVISVPPWWISSRA
jgi:Uma2 family endonuclease